MLSNNPVVSSSLPLPLPLPLFHTLVMSDTDNFEPPSVDSERLADLVRAVEDARRSAAAAASRLDSVQAVTTELLVQRTLLSLHHLESRSGISLSEAPRRSLSLLVSDGLAALEVRGNHQAPN